MKSFIRWQGNKQKYLKYLLPFIPNYQRYIEPFVGSGSLFLHLAPQKWIINDLNSDLIYIWKDVRDHPKEILKTMQDFINSTKELTKEQLLLYCRKIANTLNFMKSSPYKSGLIIILVKYEYMSLIFKNNKYYFNSLTNNLYKNISFLTQKYMNDLLKISEFINIGKIYNKDYKKILEKSKQGDFVFLDPPYIETMKHINYNKHEDFSYFLEELLQEVKKLDAKGVKWMMTQNDSKLIRKSFKEYIIKSFDVYRFHTNSYTKELIIMNYKI